MKNLLIYVYQYKKRYLFLTLLNGVISWLEKQKDTLNLNKSELAEFLFERVSKDENASEKFVAQ